MRVLASNLSGMGKSLYVKRLAQKLQQKYHPNSTHAVVPIHGPVVNADTVVTSLCKCTAKETSTAEIIHLDIASSVSANVFHIIFCLLNYHNCNMETYHNVRVCMHIYTATYIHFMTRQICI